MGWFSCLSFVNSYYLWEIFIKIITVSEAGEPNCIASDDKANSVIPVNFKRTFIL